MTLLGDIQRRVRVTRLSSALVICALVVAQAALLLHGLTAIAHDECQTCSLVRSLDHQPALPIQAAPMVGVVVNSDWRLGQAPSLFLAQDTFRWPARGPPRS